MKKLHKTLLSALCLTAILSTGGAMRIHASLTTDLMNPIRISGPVTKTDGNYLTIDNTSGQSYPGEIRVSISEHTRILDAVNGYPVAYEDIKDGESAYIYIGSAMGMSLPPVANASMVLCQVPADFKVPEYLKVSSLELNADGVSGTLHTTTGTSYTIPADAQILPYLTRNIVRIQDLTKGKTCLLWSDDQNRATKIVIFPENAQEQPPVSEWVQKDGSWYYYDEDGQMATGWLHESNQWYYLDPATGIMHTGFLTLEGKTYYMQENGSMLTKPKAFTPDENGVLH